MWSRNRTHRTIALAIISLSAMSARAFAQAEPIFLTVPASTVGTHLEFANTAGSGAFTEFSLFGAATHATFRRRRSRRPCTRSSSSSSGASRPAQCMTRRHGVRART